MSTEQRFTLSFKVEGVISALSDIPGNTADLVEKAFREGLIENLEREFDIDSDWVLNHHFDVTVTAKLEELT